MAPLARRLTLVLALAVAGALALPGVARASQPDPVLAAPSSPTNVAPHLDWTDVTPPGTYEFNVWRGAGTCASNPSFGEVNGVPLALSTVSFDDTPTPPDGAYCYYVTSFDPIKMTESAGSNQVDVTVDTVAPTTSFTSGPSGLTNVATPSFGFSASETATFRCSLDGAPSVACDSGTFTPGSALPDGPHSLTVTATDTAGNVESSPAARSFTVDTIAPTTTINSGPTGATQNASPTFTFSSTDGTATFQCQIVGVGSPVSCNGGTFTPGSALADGPHTFRVTASDPAGNVESSPPTRAFTVDTVAPTTSFTSGPSGLTNVATPSFGFSASETATFRCSLDSAPSVACDSGTFTPGSALPDGPHLLTVTATDTAGNVESSPPTRSFTVDTAPPSGSVTAPAASSNVRGTTVSLAASAGDVGGGVASVTFEVSPSGAGTWTVVGTDSGAGPSYTTTWNSTAVADGLWDVKAVVLDKAGNSASTAVVTTLVDNTGPLATSAPTPTPAQTNGTVAPSLSWAPTTDAGSGLDRYELYRDGSLVYTAHVVMSDPLSFTDNTLSGLAEGTHSYAVRAYDVAGNSTLSASSTVTLDKTAPNAATALVASTPTASAPTVGWTSSVGDVTAGSHPDTGIAREELWRDAPVPTLVCNVPSPVLGALGTSCGSDITAPPGTLHYTVKSYDGAGNVATSASLTVVYDPTNQTGPTNLTSPALTRVVPHLGWSAPANGTFNSYEVFRGPTLVTATPISTTSFDDTGAVDGTYTYKVLALAGATPGFYSNSVTVLYDSTAPGSPSALTATPQPDGSVNLGWPAASDLPTSNSAGSGVVTYVVRRSPPGGMPPLTPTDGTAACAVSAPVTSCNDATATNGGTYTYSVFARDAAGNDSSARIASPVTARDVTAPSTPQNLVGTAGDASAVLSWSPDAASGPDADLVGYWVVEKSGSAAPANSGDGNVVCALTDVTSHGCTVTGLTNGAPVSFSLFAYDEVPNYSPLGTAHVTVTPQARSLPDTTPPGKVARFAASTKAGVKAVFLRWQNPGDGDFAKVRVEQSLTGFPTKPGSGKAVYIGPGSSTSYPEKPGTTVYFSAWSYDRAGNFAPTPSTLKLKMPAFGPLNPATGTLMHGSAHLAWNSVKGASYYNVQVFQGKTRVAIAWPTSTSYTVPAGKLQKGKTYSWYVWPGYGALAKAKYGTLIGKSTFVSG